MSKDKQKFLKNIAILLCLGMIFPSNGIYTMESQKKEIRNSLLNDTESQNPSNEILDNQNPSNETHNIQIGNELENPLLNEKEGEDNESKQLLSDQTNQLPNEALSQDQQLNNQVKMPNDNKQKSLFADPLYQNVCASLCCDILNCYLFGNIPTVYNKKGLILPFFVYLDLFFASFVFVLYNGISYSVFGKLPPQRPEAFSTFYNFYTWVFVMDKFIWLSERNSVRGE